MTEHVLRRVLERSIAHVVILDKIDRYGLEATPAERDDERVASFEYFRMPAVFFQTHLYIAYLYDLYGYIRVLLESIVEIIKK